MSLGANMIQRRETGIKEMLRLGLILVCYAVASCAVLAVVNNFTSKKIAFIYFRFL